MAEEYRADLAFAWYGAAFTRMKKLPKLEEITSSLKPKSRQTNEPFRGTRIDTAMIKARFAGYRRLYDQAHGKSQAKRR